MHPRGPKQSAGDGSAGTLLPGTSFRFATARDPALPAAELDAIKAALKQRFGREVEVETDLDPSLIGGAVIDAGDVVIDGSLRGKLERLQATLAQ